MIVPIIYEISDEKVPYLWVFYKYMDFCHENNYPIIALEDYFASPDTLHEKQDSVFKKIENGYNYLWEFKEPTEELVNKLKKYPITKKEENKFCKGCKNKLEALTNLVRERNPEFEKVIQDKINKIEKDYKEKIDVILTWVWTPSLDYIAKKNNIKLITEELSTYRKNTYNKVLGYFNFENKYSHERTDKEYEEFLKNKKNYDMFSRKELLTLFLSTDALRYVKMLYYKPQYEFGIDLGMTEDPFVNVYQTTSNEKVIKKCKALVGEDRIICRTHPMKPSKTKFPNMDNSPTSVEWMLKCSKIVTSISNMGYEAMLYGKSSYIISGKMPFAKEAIEDLDSLEDHIASSKFLNYITFGYFSPYNLMFNKDYILWRAKKNPKLKEVYDYNLNYILKQSRLTRDIFKKNSDGRIRTILTKVHGFSMKEANKFIRELNADDIDTLQKKNLELTVQYNGLRTELNNILDSKGWKFMEKIRKIKPKKKK